MSALLQGTSTGNSPKNREFSIVFCTEMMQEQTIKVKYQYWRSILFGCCGILFEAGNTVFGDLPQHFCTTEEYAYALWHFGKACV